MTLWVFVSFPTWILRLIPCKQSLSVNLGVCSVVTVHRSLQKPQLIFCMCQAVHWDFPLMRHNTINEVQQNWGEQRERPCWRWICLRGKNSPAYCGQKMTKWNSGHTEMSLSPALNIYCLFEKKKNLLILVSSFVWSEVAPCLELCSWACLKGEKDGWGKKKKDGEAERDKADRG